MELLGMEMESACLTTSVLEESAGEGVEGLGRSLSDDWDDEDI